MNAPIAGTSSAPDAPTLGGPARPRLVVVGHGMVGHRFVEAAIAEGLTAEYEVVVLGEERRAAYDRVNLSKFFEAGSAEALDLGAEGAYAAAGVSVVLGDPVTRLDRGARRVSTDGGKEYPYDVLVLATGSRPFVPGLPGHDLPGCFVYRTVDDLEAIRAAASGARVGVVIGGGLLGLEAANALLRLGLETHVVELAPRLMPLQVNEAGGSVLRARVEALGVRVHVGAATRELLPGPDGRVAQVVLADGRLLDTDLIVFSAGIRARDEVARDAGLGLGPRGGVAVDARCRSTDPRIFAIGECAAPGGKIHGLVAPGYRMAEAVAGLLAGRATSFEEREAGTKLKLLGIDVASFGDAFGATPGARLISVFDGAAHTYKQLVLAEDKRTLLGGILVGDASGYGELLMLSQNRLPLPERPEALLLPAREGGARTGGGADALPDAALICSCHNLEKASLCRSIREGRLATVAAVKACTKAASGCGSCATLVGELVEAELRRAGVVVRNEVCEHFPYTRQQLYHLVRVYGLRTWEEARDAHGRGDGCEVCKPLVASLLASCWNDHVLDHAALQDTNDRFLANIQRDGTYSVVPRVAAGEITPDQLIVLGSVAKRYGLYTKLTGGQRVDLFGARLEQLPAIWRDLTDAGFESGHAYGKALRTVKSCVGSTWCRYGVQDSVGLALRLEHRYKGLRSPHKLKGAVSGCARECAEAQGKDFGVIATEQGFNVYVGGNGGMRPRHADLLAAGLDADGVVRTLDRFLMFYVRTADRLQRTATWLEKLEGGLEYLKSVILDDSLGIAAELESEMQSLVETYACEWKETLANPEKLKMFRPFVNVDVPDPSVVFVPERGQRRPASWEEKQALAERGRLRLTVLRGGTS